MAEVQCEGDLLPNMILNLGVDLIGRIWLILVRGARCWTGFLEQAVGFRVLNRRGADAAHLSSTFSALTFLPGSLNSEQRIPIRIFPARKKHTI